MPGRDPEEVQRENDLLTRKVHSQEEEFKLQNETIMHELNEVRHQIEVRWEVTIVALLTRIALEADSDSRACREKTQRER